MSSTGERVIAHVCAWKTFQQAEHILYYLPSHSEVDIEALIDNAQPQQQFYLTRTWPHNSNLSIHPAGVALERHRYGYLQPRANAPSVEAERIDMVLVPGLCFDAGGGRLGYGKGYYDRLLVTLRQDCVRVGVSAAALLVAALPQDEHDICMHYLLHENGVVCCAS